jgi:hypothetical protein
LGLTVLNLNAMAHPQEAPRLRVLLSDLAGELERCKKALDTYSLNQQHP